MRSKAECPLSAPFPGAQLSCGAESESSGGKARELKRKEKSRDWESVGGCPQLETQAPKLQISGLPRVLGPPPAIRQSEGP